MRKTWREILQVFLDDAPDSWAALREAAEAQDAAQVRERAHTIKALRPMWAPSGIAGVLRCGWRIWAGRRNWMG